LCLRKGRSSYHDVEVDGVRNRGAASYYPTFHPGIQDVLRDLRD
jgi:uncharacterized protein (DUF427 family)